jgi:hypothetical protein
VHFQGSELLALCFGCGHLYCAHSAGAHNTFRFGGDWRNSTVSSENLIRSGEFRPNPTELLQQLVRTRSKEMGRSERLHVRDE